MIPVALFQIMGTLCDTVIPDNTYLSRKNITDRWDSVLPSIHIFGTK